jgi:hypothetical protein
MSIIATYIAPSKGLVNFAAVNQAAHQLIPSLVQQWLPHGKRCGNELISINPKRTDNKPGSFSVNLTTGKWGDFASDDFGGDIISLGAYLFDTTQADAARMLATMLGVRGAA